MTMVLLSSTWFIHPDSALKRVFANVERVETVKVEVDNRIKRVLREHRLPLPSRKVLTFYRGYRGDTLIKTALVDDIKGKHLPITFMVVISPEGRVIEVEVLAYREEYGYQIGSKRFLRNFKGKGADDPLRPGKDVPNIAGATISVRSISLGVKRALVIYREVFGK